jgi:general secretion pathway protein E
MSSVLKNEDIQSRIGTELVNQSLLSQTDLERAIQVNNGNVIGLGALLVRLGMVSDKALAETCAELFDLPIMEDEEFPDVPYY